MKDSINNALVPANDGTLNGYKTIIGAIMIVAAGQIEVLRDLMPFMDDDSILETLIGYLELGLSFLQTMLEILGNVMIPWGLFGKFKKLFGF